MPPIPTAPSQPPVKSQTQSRERRARETLQAHQGWSQGLGEGRRAGCGQQWESPGKTQGRPEGGAGLGPRTDLGVRPSALREGVEASAQVPFLACPLPAPATLPAAGSPASPPTAPPTGRLPVPGVHRGLSHPMHPTADSPSRSPLPESGGRAGGSCSPRAPATPPDLHRFALGTWAPGIRLRHATLGCARVLRLARCPRGSGGLGLHPQVPSPWAGACVPRPPSLLHCQPQMPQSPCGLLITTSHVLVPCVRCSGLPLPDFRNPLP